MAITISGSGITSANIADGTIVNADVADVAASKLTGALPAIDGSALTGMPAGGKVLQVVQVAKTSATSSTGDYTIDFIAASITPSSTSSKILVMISANVASSTYGHSRLYINGAVSSFLGNPSGLRKQGSGASTHTYGYSYVVKPTVITYLHSSASTASQTYSLRLGGTGTHWINHNYGTSTASASTSASSITLMEIGV